MRGCPAGDVGEGVVEPLNHQFGHPAISIFALIRFCIFTPFLELTRQLDVEVPASIICLPFKTFAYLQDHLWDRSGAAAVFAATFIS